MSKSEPLRGETIPNRTFGIAVPHQGLQQNNLQADKVPCFSTIFFNE
jgi:hypothetical protein